MFFLREGWIEQQWTEVKTTDNIASAFKIVCDVHFSPPTSFYKIIGPYFLVIFL